MSKTFGETEQNSTFKLHKSSHLPPNKINVDEFCWNDSFCVYLLEKMGKLCCCPCFFWLGVFDQVIGVTKKKSKKKEKKEKKLPSGFGHTCAMVKVVAFFWGWETSHL